MLWQVKVLEYGAVCMGTIAGVIALDQVTKHYALLFEKRGVLPLQKGILLLTILRNKGAAYGLMKNRQRLLGSIIVTALTAIAVYLVTLAFHGGSMGEMLSLSLVTGGAAGNFIDRVRYGHVVDFLTLRLKRFPVFNAADIFILGGGILFLIYNSRLP